MYCFPETCSCRCCCTPSPTSSCGAVTWEYYIGIIETAWDCAPGSTDIISGQRFAEEEQAEVFLKRGPQRIGSISKKAVYPQYTDVLYDVIVEKPSWLGVLGPIIKGEVGDSIVVHLKNFASRNYTLHPHGVKYTKENEGKLESTA
ncbi:ferroxidase HEPHL1-like [Centrocercus urophasianus]|uniref:ferroxidase HEPHL1-like n=1 Tax=Centrocercus urophasianus TaxID=9002 RepID=UPI001C64712C|nr:ferroxidase HEPHL1-like [Centrocercus urophasianus]